jgi:hypothetical protein
MAAIENYLKLAKLKDLWEYKGDDQFGATYDTRNNPMLNKSEFS